ncbi:hypothetical protein SAMN05518672_10322 [Chitinophaga sp. CF118]|uniref:WD40 repeat domain-containing protein n=1 Tax=Chitinophaga sp. CF118 TaxID=1884367 RepID=UPI0008ECE3C2|nr:hypothetical protein [Chitinophaga sp. CF118]SFD74122.1 hypothetical protein SAMN05518672_10322 [Chitinophaga sp. CF118]
MKIELKNKQPIECMAISPDGKLLAVGQSDNLGHKLCLSIWDTASGKYVGGIESGYVVSVSFNRNSDTLAYSTNNNTVVIVDLKFLKFKKTIQMPGINKVCYARSKDLLLISGDVVVVMDEAYKELFSYFDYKSQPERAAENQFPSVAVSCDNDKSVIITGNEERKFFKFDILSGQQTATFPGGIERGVHMVTDETEQYLFLISLFPDTDLLWELKTMKRALTKHLNEKHRGASAVSFHPSSRFFVTGTAAGHIFLKNIKNADVVFKEWLHKKRVNALVFSKDGKQLISGDSGGKLLITDISEYIK